MPSAGTVVHTHLSGISPAGFLFWWVGLSNHCTVTDCVVQTVLEPDLFIDCIKNIFPCKIRTLLHHDVNVCIIFCYMNVLFSI